jgi:glycosyltransferase involved in cell wall biosynthesis
MPAVYAGWLRHDAKKALVISPRGTLHDWAWRRSRWKKRIFWAALQRRTMRRAHCLHATSEAEYCAIRERGLRQPVAVIPNGIDVEPAAGEESQDRSDRRTLLFLGRVHPVKGVPTLLEAWSRLHRKHPAWDLSLVGPSSPSYLERLRRLERKLSLQRVHFVGPLYGRDKERMYRRAELYVLPTHSENFGVTIAEALAAGTPAIVTKGAPWSGLESQGAGWWIDHGIASLTKCLDEALALSPQELAAKGAAGREWMRRSFRWSAIARDMAHAYRWLLGNDDLPSFVHLD